MIFEFEATFKKLTAQISEYQILWLLILKEEKGNFRATIPISIMRGMNITTDSTKIRCNRIF